jgi:Xaa-Pro aminopeptidase
MTGPWRTCWTYVPGELGIRHEDTVVVTETGRENLVPRWSGTPEEPAVV